MSWTIAIQAETGAPTLCGISVPSEALPSDKEKYPILSSIAPYYDTFFNPEQLQAFIAEWDKASRDPAYQESMREFMRVRDLAVKCRNEQLYLRFIGD